MQRDYRHVFCEPDADALAHLLCVCSAGIYECDKSFYEDSFYHSGFYFLCVLSGSGCICTDGQVSPVSAGHMALLDLKKPYQIYPDAADPWKFGWIRFDGGSADWLYRQICGSSHLFFAPDAAQTAAAAVESLLACHTHRAPDGMLRSAAILHELLAELYAVSRDFRSAYTHTAAYSDAVQQVADYIEVNYFRKLTLEELAGLVYLSPCHLLREFKKHTGFTPLQYTNLYRMTLAKQMLRSSNLTIEQIALNTGFCSHSYFSKSFREAVGTTPEAFRRSGAV